jgi:hypothetical protein
MAVHEARHAPVTSSGWHAARQRDPNAESAKKRERTHSANLKHSMCFNVAIDAGDASLLMGSIN